MAENVLIEELTIPAEEFIQDPDTGLYVVYLSPAPFVVEIGKRYKVVWNGTQWYCDAQDAGTLVEGAVFIGNAALFGLSGNGEPFIIGGTRSSPTNIMCLTEMETNNPVVSVYLVEEETEVPPSATVKIKGYSGVELEFKDVPKVWLAAPESTAENPVLVPFTYGEAVEGVEVTPNFSEGDMTVTMEDGLLARSAVIKKPVGLTPENIKKDASVAGIVGEYEEVVDTEEVTVAADFSGGDMVVEPVAGKFLEKATIAKPKTLIAGNIAEGVDIAGIVGTLVAGGGGVVAGGTFTGEGSAQYVFTHGLGVVPDVFIFHTYYTSLPIDKVKYMLYGVAVSTAISSRFGFATENFYGFGEYLARNSEISTSPYKLNCTSGLDGNYNNIAFKANAETVTIGGSYAVANVSYRWIAIGGLT